MARTKQELEDMFLEASALYGEALTAYANSTPSTMDAAEGVMREAEKTMNRIGDEFARVRWEESNPGTPWPGNRSGS